jgi:hypothetical protein
MDGGIDSEGQNSGESMNNEEATQVEPSLDDALMKSKEFLRIRKSFLQFSTSYSDFPQLESFYQRLKAFEVQKSSFKPRNIPETFL